MSGPEAGAGGGVGVHYGDQATYNEAVLSVLSHLTDALELVALGRSPNVMADIKAARASLAIMERLTDPTRDGAAETAGADDPETGGGGPYIPSQDRANVTLTITKVRTGTMLGDDEAVLA